MATLTLLDRRLRPAPPALTHSQELKLSDQLFGLYVDVLETLGEWKHVRFASLSVHFSGVLLNLRL